MKNFSKKHIHRARGDGLRSLRSTLASYGNTFVQQLGATPEEVENGIILQVEEALQSIEGVKKMTATASEHVGMVILELHSSVRNVDRTLNEVKEAVDRIPSFPELAENRVVQR